MNRAFLSVVAHRDKPEMLLVRARAEPDITRVFPGAQVQVMQSADYRYRAEVRRTEVATAIAGEILSIDYPNFKNSVAELQRHNAYLGVWGKMVDFQEGQFERTGAPLTPAPAKRQTRRRTVKAA